MKFYNLYNSNPVSGRSFLKFVVIITNALATKMQQMIVQVDFSICILFFSI